MKKQKTKVEMCAEAFIKAMDVFTELFDNEETTREERLEMLDIGYILLKDLGIIAASESDVYHKTASSDFLILTGDRGHGQIGRKNKHFALAKFKP